MLPDPLPALLAEQLGMRVAERPVIVDLSGITLVSATPVVDLASWVLSARQQPGQCCVVCARAAGRALLRRWHITRCLAVFGSVGDALQARRFADDGYGTGWRPGSPGSGRPDPSIDYSRAIVEHFAPHQPTAPSPTQAARSRDGRPPRHQRLLRLELPDAPPGGR
jgi:hypothetical protein